MGQEFRGSYFEYIKGQSNNNSVLNQRRRKNNAI